MPEIATIDCSVLRVPFRRRFAHAKAQRAHGDSVLVTVALAGGVEGRGEGCPRRYVTGEDAVTAIRFVERYREAWRVAVRDVVSLREWMRANAAVIDRNPAAFCAFELAILDALGKEAGCSVETLLGLPPTRGRFRYSAVIGIGSAQSFARNFRRYRNAGFTTFKLKLSGSLDRDREMLAIAARSAEDLEIRADANNLWPNAAAAQNYLSRLDLPLTAIEEALESTDPDSLRRLAEASGLAQIVDETVCRVADLDRLRGRAELWIANVRVSKMGGLLRALAFVDAARARGLRLVVGAHVGESSILTRAALPVARRAGDALYAQEGAFGTHLLDRDPFQPELRFGRAGELDFEATGVAESAGFGLEWAGADWSGILKNLSGKTLWEWHLAAKAADRPH